MNATLQIAQTTLRSVLGQHVLDELLSERDKINTIPAVDHRRGDVAVGHQGVRRRGQGCRDSHPTCSARWHGRAEAERERRAKVNLRRGRVPGVRAAEGPRLR